MAIRLDYDRVESAVADGDIRQHEDSSVVVKGSGITLFNELGVKMHARSDSKVEKTVDQNSLLDRVGKDDFFYLLRLLDTLRKAPPIAEQDTPPTNRSFFTDRLESEPRRGKGDRKPNY